MVALPALLTTWVNWNWYWNQNMLIKLGITLLYLTKYYFSSSSLVLGTKLNTPKIRSCYISSYTSSMHGYTKMITWIFWCVQNQKHFFYMLPIFCISHPIKKDTTFEKLMTELSKYALISSMQFFWVSNVLLENITVWLKWIAPFQHNT